MKAYEGLFIFGDGLGEEGLEEALKSTIEEITSHGGEVTRTEKIGRRSFARPMNKKSSGYYTRLYFNLAADQVTALLSRYKLGDVVFRVQIVVAPPVDPKREKALAAAAAEASAK